MDDLEERLHSLKPARMLDVATGRGGGAAWLASTFGGDAPIVCADLSTRGFHAESHSFGDPRMLPMVCDAGVLPLAGGSVELACCVNSLHHFPRPGAVLEEMRRVAAPGGALVISEMHSETGSDAQATHRLLHHWWARCDRLMGEYHGETFSRAELRGLVEALEPAELLVEEQEVEGCDPRDPRLMQRLETACDRYLQRLREHGGGEELVRRGLELNRRLREVGFSPAPRLLVLAFL